MDQGKGKVELEDELYQAGIIFLIAGVVVSFVAIKWFFPTFPDAECIFYRLTGLYCPGCGGTRAYLAFLQGHFLESLCYHPIVMYTVVVFGGFMLSHTLERLHVPFVRGMKFHVWHFYGALVLLAGNWVLRNILKIGFGILIK